MVVDEGGNQGRTSLTGVQVGVDVTLEEKIWNILTAMGNMAFAYAFSMVLIEIQVSFFFFGKKNSKEFSFVNHTIKQSSFLNNYF